MAFEALYTEIGLQKLAEAIANNGTLDLYQIAAGDASGIPYEPDGTETDLVNEVWRGLIIQLIQDPIDPTIVIAKALVDASVGGWTIREVGIYDTDGDLIVIANYPDAYKNTVPEGAVSEFYIQIEMKVDNVDVLNLAVDPSIIYITKSEFEESIESIQFNTYRDHFLGKHGLSGGGGYEFNLTFNYSVGSKDLLVFKGPQLLRGDGNDYTEVNLNTVRLLSPINTLNNLTFAKLKTNEYQREHQIGSGGILTGGKYRFSLTNMDFSIGNNNLLVFKGGILLKLGDDYDEVNNQVVDIYLETNPTNHLTFISLNLNSFKRQHLIGSDSEIEAGRQRYTLTEFKYNTNSDDLFVFKGGGVIREGYDYDEINSNTIDLYLNMLSTNHMTLIKLL